jgi:benzoyl-CoA reductase/2-hydroxyglutaryl-CoA dehydratase subunit BcrC/BadD/HgdB
VVGETTCDGKKKAYELFGEYAPVYVMEIPQMKQACDRELWRAEVNRFKALIEAITGKEITAAKLKEAIKLVNSRRRVLQRLNRLRAVVPTPISGRDVLLIKLPYIVESSGAVIVGEESCIGTRNTRDLVDEAPDTLEGLLDALVERYMRIDCACFTPNEERLQNIVAMAQDLKVKGVIHFALNFCQPYAMEAFKVGRALEAAGFPMLSLETDYSMEDVEQLKTRVEAFLEMVH